MRAILALWLMTGPAAAQVGPATPAGAPHSAHEEPTRATPMGPATPRGAPSVEHAHGPASEPMPNASTGPGHAHDHDGPRVRWPWVVGGAALAALAAFWVRRRARVRGS